MDPLITRLRSVLSAALLYTGLKASPDHIPWREQSWAQRGRQLVVVALIIGAWVAIRKFTSW